MASRRSPTSTAGANSSTAVVPPPQTAARRSRDGSTPRPTALFVSSCSWCRWCSCCRCRRPTGRCWAATRAGTSPTTSPRPCRTGSSWTRSSSPCKYTVLATVLLIGSGLGLALLVQESTRWKGILRTSFLVPSALGLASASLLFYVLYSPLAGPFADLMNRLGITFLGTPDGALWSTVFLIVWRYAGFYMLLMLVGLQGIPDRACSRPHASTAPRAWQTFRRITIPLLRPTLGPDDGAVRHRLAAGLRAVLHPHQGRPGQQHDHHRPARSTTWPSRARTTSAWPPRSRCWSWAH